MGRGLVTVADGEPVGRTVERCNAASWLVRGKIGVCGGGERLVRPQGLPESDEQVLCLSFLIQLIELISSKHFSFRGLYNIVDQVIVPR